ncbi:hypothetical protein KGF56_000687 [Candida oxycetoniae]|uniref:LSM12 anticodon-binding domain-containing protein n=1 Tax=Candida oxycetoniae TaxID=497107 RepID=A0AAI9T1X2_9ASCO|nr:uncharacterized protein KGF56_000687 [Candida oxycetoniae]KAI3406555.2 hypothetical protein KGF56_000687 [Candida oxycetoniae]
MSIHIKNFDQVLNLKIKVTTLLDQEMIGVIYTYSSSNEILVLKTSNLRVSKDNKQVDPTSTYRVINTSIIKSIQVLPPFPSKKNNLKPYKRDEVSIKPINIQDLKKFVNNEILKLDGVEQPKKEQEKPISSLATEPRHIPQHNTTPGSSIASQLFEKLTTLYGVKNIKYGDQKRMEIIIHDEIKLIKPFTNTQKNIQFINDKQQSKHTQSLNRALKQFWLEIDNEKKGG